MKPRSFFNKHERSVAIFTTFSFDPTFFEQIVLPELQAHGVKAIFILVDGNQLDRNADKLRNTLFNAGKRYIIRPVYLKGAFHSKLILVVGPSEANLWCGSGNLNYGGWGGNREIAVTKQFGPEEATSVRGLISSLEQYIQGETAQKLLDSINRFSWLKNAEGSTDTGSCLISGRNGSIGEQLKRRWAKKRFKKLTLTTGSTDENGAMVDWANKTFGMKECHVIVEDQFCAFKEETIKELPMSVQISLLEDSRRLHAKYYCFENDDEVALVTGSANCSRAAWLLSPEQGGNIEAVIVHDSITKEGFENPIKQLKMSDKDFQYNPVSEDGPEEKNDLHQHHPNVLSLEYDTGKQRVTAWLSSTLPEKVMLRIDLGNLQIPMESEDRSEWYCTHTLEHSSTTNFADIAFLENGQAIRRVIRWFDESTPLMKFAEGRVVIERLPQIGSGMKLGRLSNLMRELQELQNTLIQSTHLYTYQSYRQAGSESKEGEKTEDSTPLEPEQLIGSLNDSLPQSASYSTSRSGLNYQFSVTGVLDLLFQPFREEEEEPEPEETLDQGEEGYHPDESFQSDLKARKILEPEERAIEERFHERLKTQLQKFFLDIESTRFVTDCSASQMVEAIAYPLGVAANLLSRDKRTGQKLYTATAREWILKTVQCLLLPRNGRAALIDIVKERSGDSEFAAVAGDGGLWVAILASLTQIDQQIHLQDVVRLGHVWRKLHDSRELYANIDNYKFKLLMNQVAFEDALQRCGQMDFTRLLQIMRDVEDLLVKTDYPSAFDAPEYKAENSDIVFNQKFKWGIVHSVVEGRKPIIIDFLSTGARKKMSTSVPCFHNLRILSKKNPVLKRRLLEMAKVIGAGGGTCESAP